MENQEHTFYSLEGAEESHKVIAECHSSFSSPLSQFYWPVSPFFEHDPLWTIFASTQETSDLVLGVFDYNGTGHNCFFCISVTTTPLKNMNVSFGN